MILKKVNLSPYIVELWIIITDDPAKDIPKLNKKYKGLEIQMDAQTAAWTNDHFYDDNTLGVAFDVASFEPDVVAHEAVHIVNMTFQHAGYKLAGLNDEHQAYFTGWIVGEIHKAYEEYKIKLHKKKYAGK